VSVIASHHSLRLVVAGGAAVALWLAGPAAAWAMSGAALDRDSRTALAKLYKADPVAQRLGESAKGILVFPSIVKAGFMFGGQLGEGALLKNGGTAGYYSSVAASYGLQAGVQVFGYALFFMDTASLASFESGSGFEIGVGPSIVVVDKGFGKSMTNKTLQSGIYAVIFDQKGLMAGLGLQGSKITRITK
jgi:lipid-binding SYLF domain-containing protein